MRQKLEEDRLKVEGIKQRKLNELQSSASSKNTSTSWLRKRLCEQQRFVVDELIYEMVIVNKSV